MESCGGQFLHRYVESCGVDAVHSSLENCRRDTATSSVEQCGEGNVHSSVEQCGGDNVHSSMEQCGGDNVHSSPEPCGGGNLYSSAGQCDGDKVCSSVEPCGRDNVQSTDECSGTEKQGGAVKRSSSQKEGGPKKKIRTAPTNTSLLPPCRVCLAPAAGFHYGANTCEACKGFFRRSLLRTQAYKCQGKGNCNIGAGKRKICPKCRYIKCLSIGMSKEAIKTGRYTHAKRTQDILEYRQIFQEKSNNTETVPSYTSAQTHDHNIQNNSIQIGHTGDSQLNDNSIGNNHLSNNHFNSVQFSSDQTCGLAVTSSLDSSKEPCPPDIFLNSEPASLFDTPFTLSPLTSGHSVIEQFGRVDESDPLSPVISILSPKSCSISSSDLLQGTENPQLCQLMSDIECECIVRQLVEAHRKHLVSATDSLTPQQLLHQQVACYEACQVKQEMFGHRSLSDEEYHEVYQMTGLDVAVRASVLTMIDGIIRQYIAFAKHIPGFSDLMISDQIRLIKDNRAEFRMFSTFHLYNQQLQVMTLPSGRTECVHELSKLMDMNEICERFQCAEVIRKLGLSAEELIVLKSWMVVCVGNDDVEEIDKVSHIQWRMAQCLRWLLQQNRCDGDRTFARIMTAVCRIRELCHGFYIWLKSKPFIHPMLQNNTLLSEWFSIS